MTLTQYQTFDKSLKLYANSHSISPSAANIQIRQVKNETLVIIITLLVITVKIIDINHKFIYLSSCNFVWFTLLFIIFKLIANFLQRVDSEGAWNVFKFVCFSEIKIQFYKFHMFARVACAVYSCKPPCICRVLSNHLFRRNYCGNELIRQPIFHDQRELWRRRLQ